MSADGSAVRAVVSGSAASVARAVASSASNTLLPITLVVLLAPADFRVWALAFGFAAYVNYLDGGLQGGTQALVGRAFGAGGVAAARAVLAVVAQVLTRLTAGIVVLGALLAVGFVDLFPGITRSRAEVAWLVGALVAAQTANLVANVLACYFTAIRDYWPMTGCIVAGRVVGAAAAFGLAELDSGLVVIALGYLVPVLAATVALVALVGRGSRASAAPVPSRGDVLRYSGPLVLWNICLLVLAGVGTFVVGRFDYGNVAVYSIAIIVSNGLSGLAVAALQPVLSEIGRRIGGDLPYERLVLRVQRATSALVATACCGIALVLAVPAVRETLHLDRDDLVWVVVIVGAAAVRLLTTPLSQLFIATGTHRRVMYVPAVETLATVVPAAAFGVWFGVGGVALSYLGGAVVGVLIIVGWCVPATGVLPGHTVGAIGRLVAGAAAPFLVLAAVVVVVARADPGAPAFWSVLAVAALVAVVLAARESGRARDGSG